MALQVSDDLAYRALLVVRGLGFEGCRLEQFGNALYPKTKDRRKNVVASQILACLAARGLLQCVGETPKHAIHTLSAAGRRYIEERQRAAAARAEERAQASRKGGPRAGLDWPRAAPEPPENELPAPKMGFWS